MKKVNITLSTNQRVLKLEFFLLISIFLILPIICSSTNILDRGGIEFTINNSQLVRENGNLYLSVDIMVNSLNVNSRLGTGIVLLNYNPQSFGNYVQAAGNLIVSRGELLTSITFPVYHLYIQDNAPNRLAITYEYTSSEGNGSLLTLIPQTLLNIKLKVQTLGYPAGLSFQSDLMANEQYQDDNSTLLSPVIAIDIENSILPAVPSNIILTAGNPFFTLSWDQCPTCTYSVYSSSNPYSDSWQLEVSNLTQPSWNFIPDSTVKFYKVIASGIELRD